jgi:heme exporter protein B
MMASLVCGTPTLILLCALAAGLSTTLQQKGVLMGLIVLPLTVPIMILGSATLNAAIDGLMVEGYLACLTALSCLAIAGVPFAIAGALRENG